MTSKNSIYLLAILFASLVGCKPKMKTYSLYNTDLLNAADVKEGSYFIYKDSASGLTDSFYCDYYWHGQETERDKDGSGANALYDVENYSLRANDSLQPKRSLSFVAFDNHLYCSYTPSYKSNVQDTTYGTIVLYFPYPGNGVLVNPYMSYISLNHYPLFTVEGKSYDDVHEYTSRIGTQLYNPSGTDTITLHTFYSTKSGLVKYCITHHSEYHAWHLVRSSILR